MKLRHLIGIALMAMISTAPLMAQQHEGRGMHRGPHKRETSDQRRHGDYKVEASNVYFANVKIKGASANDFKILGNGYAKDNFNVYYHGIAIDASAMSFERLADGYAKDAFHIYFNGQETEGQVATFEVLNSGYAKDAFAAFHKGRKIEGAQASTFTTIGRGMAKDAFKTYKGIKAQ